MQPTLWVFSLKCSLLYLFSLSSLWHLVWTIFLPLDQTLNWWGSYVTHGGHISRVIPKHRDYTFSNKCSRARKSPGHCASVIHTANLQCFQDQLWTKAHLEKVLGSVQKLTLAREHSWWQFGCRHLIWRIREFNSMDRLFHAIWAQRKSWGHLIDLYVHYLWLFVLSYQRKEVLLFSKSF